jgi:hypothetical protein
MRSREEDYKTQHTYIPRSNMIQSVTGDRLSTSSETKKAGASLEKLGLLCGVVLGSKIEIDRATADSDNSICKNAQRKAVSNVLWYLGIKQDEDKALLNELSLQQTGWPEL